MKKIFYSVIFLFFFAYEAQALTLTQNFDLQIGLFNAGKVKISYGLNDHYFLSSEIQTAGLFDTFYSFQAKYFTSGLLVDKAWITQDYHQQTKSSSHTRQKRLIFDKQGVLKQRISAKDKEEKTIDIGQISVASDAYDIQTVLLMMIDHFQKTQSCALSKTVFNSKKVYHIRISDGPQVFYKNKKTNLSGQAQICKAYIHQDKAEKGDLLWQVSAEKEILFYVMQDQKTGLPFVPEVDISSTPLGDLKAYATEYYIED